MAATRKPKNVIGSAVARCRNDREWSQATLAAKCQLAGWDISRGIIAGIEGKVRAVQDWELLVLGKVLGIPTDSLLPAELDWQLIPLPSERTQAKRRRVLERTKAKVRRKAGNP